MHAGGSPLERSPYRPQNVGLKNPEEQTPFKILESEHACPHVPGGESFSRILRLGKEKENHETEIVGNGAAARKGGSFRILRIRFLALRCM